MDDDGIPGVSSFRVADSYASSIAEVDHERALPQDELDNDNDLSTPGCGVGPSPDESALSAVPGLFTTIGRSTSTPPEILRVNPPGSLQQQLRPQDHPHSSTSSSSSISPDNSYTRFFHRTRTPRRTRSTRSLGPGAMPQGGPSALSPIYEPSNPDLRDSDSTRKEGVVVWPSTKKTPASSVHSTSSTIQEKVMCMQGTRTKGLVRFGLGLNFIFSLAFIQHPPIPQSLPFLVPSYLPYANTK